MKYQKAKVISCEYPECIGLELWVRMERPTERQIDKDIWTGEAIDIKDEMFTLDKESSNLVFDTLKPHYPLAGEHYKKSNPLHKLFVPRGMVELMNDFKETIEIHAQEEAKVLLFNARKELALMKLSWVTEVE